MNVIMDYWKNYFTHFCYCRFVDVEIICSDDFLWCLRWNQFENTQLNLPSHSNNINGIYLLELIFNSKSAKYCANAVIASHHLSFRQDNRSVIASANRNICDWSEPSESLLCILEISRSVSIESISRYLLHCFWCWITFDSCGWKWMWRNQSSTRIIM